MSSVIIEKTEVQAVQGSEVMGPEHGAHAIRFRGLLQAWWAAALAWVLAPRRDQRGVTTIEYIFGAILAIAIVTVVVGVIKNPAVGALFMTLIEWVMKFRGE